MIKEIAPSYSAALGQVSKLELPRRRRMIFTGNGTAFFSAWMGSQVLRNLGLDHEVFQSFELEHYEEPVREDILVGVSHSGITKSTTDSLRKAREAGAYVVGVTHFEGRPIEQVCDATVVVGNGPDKSRCHTKTYVASAAAVAGLGLKEARLHGLETGRVTGEMEGLANHIAKVTEKSEPWAKEMVNENPAPSQVVFAGAGPNLVTSREAALKIKESSYLPSEGIELEEEMHGPWVSLDSQSVLVVVAPAEHLMGRALDLVQAGRKLQVTTVAVGGRGLGADYEYVLPQTDEILSPYLAIIPLYFYAYFLSVKLGHNPDYLRYLEPAYWDARQNVFPPGTH